MPLDAQLRSSGARDLDMRRKLHAIWGKLRDLFSIERQMTDEARAGHAEWLKETEPMQEGFINDQRGLGNR